MISPPLPSPIPLTPVINSNIEPIVIKGKYKHSNIHENSGLVTLDQPINGIKYAVVLKSTLVKGSLIEDGVEVTGIVRLRAPRSYILSEVTFPNLDEKPKKKSVRLWKTWFDIG